MMLEKAVEKIKDLHAFLCDLIHSAILHVQLMRREVNTYYLVFMRCANEEFNKQTA